MYGDDMKNIPVSLFLGPLCLIAFYILCLIIVAGIKILYYYFKRSPVKITKAAKRVKTPTPVPKEKPVRSIEINPDEVDKIYVKKVS